MARSRMVRGRTARKRARRAAGWWRMPKVEGSSRGRRRRPSVMMVMIDASMVGWIGIHNVMIDKGTAQGTWHEAAALKR